MDFSILKILLKKWTFEEKSKKIKSTFEKMDFTLFNLEIMRLLSNLIKKYKKFLLCLQKRTRINDAGSFFVITN